ncbi:HigA family addiction module antitoxin [Qipengyuania sediminis]|uniref:HigA family addiction module antitoxin n=1 Tax=Qipengyuania sediminis TaxID=1532023 RepID=UPI0014049D90|nr:HigA family addiction module antitoxin [Qipengyuania sediminis]
MKENSRLLEPPRVSEVLRAHFLTLDGVTQDRLAQAMNVSRHSVSELMNDRRAITAPMAVRLAHVLGTDAEFWLNLQQARDLFEARQDLHGALGDLKIIRPPVTEADVVQ